ncbi:MAG TPA: hypothetical protein VLG69_04045 [Candidatus Andersenbacteria bacterium]|nr:hypothetical protein [Candidatus Andersenbacteria bacterium]
MSQVKLFLITVAQPGLSQTGVSDELLKMLDERGFRFATQDEVKALAEEYSFDLAENVKEEDALPPFYFVDCGGNGKLITKTQRYSTGICFVVADK